ncbi:restriction endonuclease subunit S [Vibrio kanaloae]|uniref:restriction endonuclease subunit S n=1 Tax=Vibrio kanaloae TaxID=170673 RepID=UPI00355080B3
MITFQPTNWKKLQLSEVCDLQGGFAFKSKDFTQRGIPLVKISNIKNLDIVMDNCVYVDSVKEQFLVSKDDILIAMSGATTGKIGRYTLDKPAALNQRVGAFKPHQKLSSDYLFYVLQQDRVVSEWLKDAIGGAQPNINPSNVLDVEILLPSMEEQQKIAEFFSTIDKKIDLIGQKIAEIEKLKTGLMQKLFSEGVGVQDENGNWQPHTEFQDSPFGKVPKCWLKVSLENIASVERGKFSARPRNDPKYFGGNIPFVQTGDVVNAQLYVESYSQTLNELGLTVSKTFPPETILITIAANIGDVAITQFPLACPDSLVGIQAKKEICNSLWLFFFMQTQKSELDSKATKSAQKNINLQVLKPLTVFLPSLEEQELIAEILLASEKKIALLKQQKTETQQLKKGLMQKLLTGEWRVPVEETEAA